MLKNQRTSIGGPWDLTVCPTLYLFIDGNVIIDLWCCIQLDVHCRIGQPVRYDLVSYNIAFLAPIPGSRSLRSAIMNTLARTALSTGADTTPVFLQSIRLRRIHLLLCRSFGIILECLRVNKDQLFQIAAISRALLALYSEALLV